MRFHDITDFVPALGSTETTITGEPERDTVALKTGPKKVKLEQVTTRQCSEANRWIILQLLSEGTLLYGNGALYIQNTIHVSELATVYTWQSVLQCDRAYRKA